MKGRTSIGLVVMAAFAVITIAFQNTPALANAPSGPVNAAVSSGQIQKINLNTADNNELQEIRGVGPVMAERILQYRSEHSRFQTIDELINVRGIGPVKFEKLKDQVSV